MKVVVTGGSGQLGSLVLERLASDRKVKRVVSLDLVPPRVPSPKIDFRIADLRDPGLERHLEGADTLVHLAFVVAGAPSREEMRSINVDGTRAAFEAAVHHGLRRVVYASSVAAYGVVPGHPDPIVESTPRKRTGTLDYADHKFEIEEMLDSFEAEHPNLSVLRLRPGILVGRRIAHIPAALVRRRIMPIVGDEPAPIVWDEDVADATLRALHSELCGGLNLVADDPISSREFARLAGFRPLPVSASAAEKLLAAASAVRRAPADRGWVRSAGVRLRFSSGRAKEELGWKPRYPTSADVATAFGKQASARTDRRVRLFLSLVPGMSRRARQRGDVPRDGRLLSLKIHLDLTGRDGGDFALELRDGVMQVRRGIPQPPDATVTMEVDTFVRMLGGSTNPSTAAMTGKIRVRGEPLAGMVVGGMVEGFRRGTEQPGAAGAVARGLSRLFEKGSGE